MNFITKRRRLLLEFGLLYSAAIWGSTFFVVKDLLNNINPLILVSYRFIIAAIFLGVFCFFAKKSLLENIKHGLFLGFILWLLYVSQTIGLGITTASNSGFITGLFVAFVPFFGFLIFRRVPTFIEFIATGVSLAGLWILTGGLSEINLGDLFTIIAALMYAIHILLINKYVNNGDNPYTLSFQQFLVVGIASIFSTIILDLPLSITGWNNIGIILFLALLPTLSAFVIQVVAQQFVEPIRVSLILAFEPVFAALFAWTLGNEPVILHRAIGGFFIFFGMILSEVRLKI